MWHLTTHWSCTLGTQGTAVPEVPRSIRFGGTVGGDGSLPSSCHWQTSSDRPQERIYDVSCSRNSNLLVRPESTTPGIRSNTLEGVDYHSDNKVNEPEVDDDDANNPI